MIRTRTLEAEKENLQRGQGEWQLQLKRYNILTSVFSVSSKSLPHPSSSSLLTASPSFNDDMLRFIKALELKVEAVEAESAERKKDLEKAEAQRKKDLDKAEAQRKKDLEKADSQRKKDLEKAEAQRKRDIEKVETQREKLKLDLEGKIERLERHANERDLEQKQADEATKRYIECIAENVDATNDFLAVGVCLLYIHPLNFRFSYPFLH